jgi:Rod binding domain-containing protein
MIKRVVNQNVPLNKGTQNRINERVNEAAKGMEKMFIKFMVDELRKSNDKVDVFGDAPKNDFFESELYDQYAKAAADRGDFGIAKMIKEHLNRSNMIGRKK